MADIELRLIANNEQYVQGIKESQTAYQSFNNTVVSGSKEQEEFIDGVIEGMKHEIENIKNAEKAVSKTGTTFKTQLRGIKEELAKMEAAGLAGSKRFQELSIQAGKLEDQIGDTAHQIKILASDTKNLDAAMSVGQGLAGGFALAQGAMALFGSESENLQKQLVKLQGGLNLLNGMQQVANTLNKDSAARVVLLAKAQQAYNLIVGQSTGAMKAFKLALAATGIGTLLIGLGLLIANWDKVKKSIENLFSPNRELASQIQTQITLINQLTEANQKRTAEIDRQIALLEAIGGKEEEIFQLRKERAKAEMQIELQKIDLTRKQLQLAQEEFVQRAKMNVQLSGTAAGALFAKLFFNTEKSVDSLVDLNKQLTEQDENFKNLENSIKILDALEVKRVNTAKEKAVEKSLDAQKKKAQELADLLKQLADKEQSALLNNLTGLDRINAEEQIQLKEVDMLKKHLESLSKLTKEQYQQIENIKTSINLDADKKRDEFRQNELNKTKEQAEKVKDLQRKIAEDQLELLGASEVEKLKLKQKFILEDIKQLEKANDSNNWLQIANMRQQVELIQQEINKLSGDGNKFSIWKLLGFDPETDEGKAGIEAMKEASSIIIDQVAQIMDAELKQAEQHTQLIEKRLDEAKNALEQEKELQEQGLANNVDAKQREIAQLKIEREKALEDEKKAQKAQLLLDSATQLSSLITATANIWKSFSSLGPVGPVLAVAATGLMFGTFAAAKIKAFQAINSQDTELEKGGYGDSTGVISGKRHANGGERFLDHVEVEDGEAWGVFNRQATNKFGALIPYIVDSMNNLKFPNLSMQSGKTVVNFDTKKMTSKLDSIDSGIKTLNDNMSNQTDAFYAGKTKIIKLSKNHTRIIHAAN